MNSAVVSVSQVAAKDLGRIGFNLRYYFRSRPVLITDGASHWQAVPKWSPDYLRSRLGARPVMVKYNERGIFDYNRSARTGRVHSFEVPFGSAVDRILAPAGNVHYIQQESIAERFPELLPDILPPQLLDPAKRVLVTNLWFGAKGCKTPLHFDRVSNFLVQVLGRKRVMLFPPEETRHLYPAVGDKLPHCSRVNVFSSDMADFPLFQHALARKLELEIGPGNVLYIPKGWWHAVESLDVSISVNVWWAGVAELFMTRTLPRLFSRRRQAERRAARAH